MDVTEESQKRENRENPVLLIHASSHMGVTNSRGLEAQGITEATEDCPGGRYGRVAETREPEGLRKRQRTVRVDVTEESQKRENRMVIWKRRYFWHSRKSFR